MEQHEPHQHERGGEPLVGELVAQGARVPAEHRAERVSHRVERQEEAAEYQEGAEGREGGDERAGRSAHAARRYRRPAGG